MTNVKNNTESSIRIGTTNLRGGTTAHVDRWDIHQHNDHVRDLLDAKAIEVVSTEEDAAPPRYTVKETSPGWYGIFDRNDVQHGKNMRRDDAEAFQAMTPQEQTAEVAREAEED